MAMVDVPLEDEMDAALRRGREIVDANQRLIADDEVSRPLYMVALVVVSGLAFVAGFVAGIVVAWIG